MNRGCFLWKAARYQHEVNRETASETESPRLRLSSRDLIWEERGKTRYPLGHYEEWMKPRAAPYSRPIPMVTFDHGPPRVGGSERMGVYSKLITIRTRVSNPLHREYKTSIRREL